MSSLSVRTCLLAMLWLLAPAAAKAVDCNRAMHASVEHIAMPGAPFGAVSSLDGCSIFVSLAYGSGRSPPGVAVLSRHDGTVFLERVVPLAGSPGGLAVTHDGKLLVVADGPNVAFVDTERAARGGQNAVLGYWSQPGAAIEIYVAVTSDDHYAFVSNEAAGTVNVLDLVAIRRNGFGNSTPVATIPVGSAPVGLSLSSDDRYLFASTQSVPSPGRPNLCHPEGKPQAPPDHAEGAIAVIDAKLAATGSDKSLVRQVSAGCNPVRVVVSPGDERVYVTARGNDMLLTFSFADLVSPGVEATAVQLPVGSAPVGLAVIEGGRRVVVSNTNRFGVARDRKSSLYVIDADDTAGDSTPVLGVLPEKGFPREIRSTADGRTLLVTNFTGRTLEILDLPRKPWAFKAGAGEPRDAWLTLRPLPTFAAGRPISNGSACCPVVAAAATEVAGL